MITLFVSATAVFLGFLFLRDTKGKPLNPSWIKIFFYFITLVVVGAFFYKTNQVMTVNSNITIENYRSYVSKNDSTQVADSIETVEIYNSFLSNSHNNSIRYKDEENKSSNVSFTIRAPKSDNCTILDAVPRGIINNLAQELKMFPQHIGRMYQVNYATSCVIPFVPVLLSKDSIYNPITTEGNTISRKYKNTNIYDKEGMIGVKSETGVTEDLPDFVEPTGLLKYYSKTGRLTASSHLNVNSDLHFNETIEGSVFDFFTAADISQYILSLGIHSPCHIQVVNVLYDLPVEIQSDERGVLPGTFGFHIYGAVLRDMVNGDGASFYVKLPTMANLQTVRSFILTTLIAALLALLISSLGDMITYYRIKGERLLLSKVSKNGVKTPASPQIKEKRQFLMARNSLLLMLSCFICFISYRSYIDEPFVKSAQEYSLCITRLVFIALVALIFLAFMYYRYLKKIISLR